MKKEQETAEKAETLGLKLLTGGKDGGEGDWLSKVTPGTYFLARPRKTTTGDNFEGFTLLEFFAGGWSGRARVVIQEDPNTGAHQSLTVDSVRFSSIMELFDQLEPPQPDTIRGEEETEPTHDTSDLPRPG